MQVKKRKSSTKLAENIQRQRLLLEQRLLEAETAWLDKLVNADDAYYGPDGTKWYAHDLSELSVPFATEHDLTEIRRRARQVSYNPYAQNLMGNLISFVIGTGHKYTVSARRNASNRDGRVAVRILKKFVDKLLLANRWLKRQPEIYRRQHRDGETFLRIFPQENGLSYWRFIEPAYVTTPADYQSVPHADFGILTDPDDVETPLTYFVNEEEVPATEIQHRKANVDMTVKRGLSSLYCIGSNLDRGRDLLRNMSTVVAMQSAIAMIRKHDRSASSVRSFVSNQSGLTTVTDPATGETRRHKRLRPGSILDTTKGTEYEFPAIGLNPSAPVSVLGAELRAIASSKSQPEYMVGSDASNANYASTKEAGTPAVRFFEQEQAEQIAEDLELIFAAVRHAMSTGLLPRNILRLATITVEAPPIVTRNEKELAEVNNILFERKIKSPQSWAAELGLDFDQEQMNFQAFEDMVMNVGNPLSLTDPPSLPGSVENQAEAEGVVAVMTALAEGALTPRAAALILQQYFGMDEATATAMVEQ